MGRTTAIVFALLMLQTAVSAGTPCTFSSENGVPTFQLSPIPEPHCTSYWSDGKDYQLGSSDEFDKSLVEAIIEGKISLKKCMTTVKCLVECEKDFKLYKYLVECSANCTEIQPAPGPSSAPNSDNKRSETCGALCITLVVVVLVVLVALTIGLLLWKFSEGVGRSVCGICNRFSPSGQPRKTDLPY